MRIFTTVFESKGIEISDFLKEYDIYNINKFNKSSNILIITGISASGKTHLSANLCEKFKYSMLDLDAMYSSYYRDDTLIVSKVFKDLGIDLIEKDYSNTIQNEDEYIGVLISICQEAEKYKTPVVICGNQFLNKLDNPKLRLKLINFLADKPLVMIDVDLDIAVDRSVTRFRKDNTNWKNLKGNTPEDFKKLIKNEIKEYEEFKKLFKNK